MARKPKPRNKASRSELGSSVGSLLGKRNSGQDALFGTKNKEELTNTIAKLPLAQIERNTGQPRKTFDEAALDELAESIKEHGIIQPITVRRLSEKEYQIISGERRYRASKLAGLKEIPAYVIKADTVQLLEMGIVENLQREDLTTLEFVDSLVKLKYLSDPPLTDKQLGDKIGKGRATVTNYLRIAELNESIKQSINDGSLTFGHAKALAGIEDKILRNEVFTEAIDLGLSVRALERHIKAIKEGKAEAGKKEEAPLATKKELSADYEAVQKSLKDFFGNGRIKLAVDEAKGKGKITIPFNSVADLNNMLDLLEK